MRFKKKISTILCIFLFIIAIGTPILAQDDNSVNDTDSLPAGYYFGDTLGTPSDTANLQPNEFDEYSMIGPYTFNMAGNTNIFGDFNGPLDSKLNHVEPEIETACANVSGDTNSYHSNSSSSILTPLYSDSTIEKAYLIVDVIRKTINDHSAAKYGVFFAGPKGKVNHYYPDDIFIENGGARSSFYVDVTDFVKEQGYGEYIGINIPYGNTYGTASGDKFAAWKLLVVESSSQLDTRITKYMLGGSSVTGGRTADVVIDTEGLTVKNEPTGEIVVSFSGYDMDNSGQYMTYTVDNEREKNIYDNPYRSESRFFTGQISNRGESLNNNPGPTIAYTQSGSIMYLNDINNGKQFYTANTDFSIIEINDPDNNIVFSGGEAKVKFSAKSPTEPSILSAIGLSIDINAADIVSDIIVTNNNKGYSTSDTGYDIYDDFAAESDTLKVDTVTTNVSENENTGVYDPNVVISVPAVSEIYEETVKAWYYDSSTGQTTEVTDFEINGNTITVKNDGKDFQKGDKITVSFEGKANGSENFKTYDDNVHLEGKYIDEDGNKYENYEQTLGFDSVITSSNSFKALPSVEKTMINLSDDNTSDINPHDKLQYQIEIGNRLEGTYWTNVVVTDTLPEAVTLDETSVELVSPSGESVDQSLYQTTYDETTRELKVTLAFDIPGGETYVLKYQVEVKDNVLDSGESIDKNIRNYVNVTGNDKDTNAEVNEDDILDSGDVVEHKTDPYISKKAENITGSNDATQVGDKIAYEITIKNREEGAIWYDVIMRDVLPENIVPELGTFRLSDGKSSIDLSDDIYDKDTNTITVFIGDVDYNETYTLSFLATVVSSDQDNAEDTALDLGNLAEAIGNKDDEIINEGEFGEGNNDPDDDKVYPGDQPDKDTVIDWENPKDDDIYVNTDEVLPGEEDSSDPDAPIIDDGDDDPKPEDPEDGDHPSRPITPPSDEDENDLPKTTPECEEEFGKDYVYSDEYGACIIKYMIVDTSAR